jgi:hypothetical protein
MTDFSALAAAPSLDLAIAEAQGKVTVTRLPRRNARRSECVMSRVGGAGTRWNNSTGGNGRLKAGQLRPDEIALKAAFR